jgi:hypothetical protein
VQAVFLQLGLLGKTVGGYQIWLSLRLVCVFPPYAASQVTKHAVEALQRDYGEDADKLFATMHFINRGVIQRKLVRAVLQPYGDGEDANPFVIAFSGTSVTAGHDNFFNQSYPLVFERELSRSFTAAGIDLVVRNHAMGNNPAMPSCFCVGSQLGSDTDVAVWEFGMMVQGLDAVVSLETWIRNALFLPKQPAVMVLDPGGGERGPKEDGTLQTEPYLPTPGDYSRGFSDQGRDLLRYYEHFGIHAQVSWKTYKSRVQYRVPLQSGKRALAKCTPKRKTPSDVVCFLCATGHVRGNVAARHQGALQLVYAGMTCFICDPREAERQTVSSTYQAPHIKPHCFSL